MNFPVNPYLAALEAEAKRGAGPVGVADMTKSAADFCDEGKRFITDLRVMLAELQASAWWAMLTKKDGSK